MKLSKSAIVKKYAIVVYVTPLPPLPPTSLPFQLPPYLSFPKVGQFQRAHGQKDFGDVFHDIGRLRSIGQQIQQIGLRHKIKTWKLLPFPVQKILQ